MTFAEFINTRCVTANARGDFIDDTQMLIRAKRFPGRWSRKTPWPQSWDNLERFLVLRSACPEAIAAGKSLWREYLRHEKKNGGAQ